MANPEKCPGCGAGLAIRGDDAPRTVGMCGRCGVHISCDAICAKLAQEQENVKRQKLALGACLGALDQWRKAVPPGLVSDPNWKRAIKADARAREAAAPGERN